MEENIKIEFSETTRGKEQIIINRKFKFNYSTRKKDNSLVYRCTEYKTLNKCKSFIVLNEKKEIIKYEGTHNHLEKETDASLSIVRHKIKDEVRKSSVPFDIKPKNIYNEISQDMGVKCPKFKTIKYQIAKSIEKQQPTDISSFDEIPDESDDYKTERDEDFMIFKNSNLVIFQSPFQAELFTKYSEDIYADSRVHKASRMNYHVFITRVFVSNLDSFFVTSFSLLNNTEQTTYETLFSELKKNACKFTENADVAPKNIYCDFDEAITSAAKNIFPDINIKYNILYYKKSLEIQKNNLCLKEVENNNDLYIYYKAISNLPFINPERINDIYNEIKCMCQTKNYDSFLKFLEYFEQTYLHNYDINQWNYCNYTDFLTNNYLESLNNFLNKLLGKNPSFYKLINILKKDESLSYKDYQKRMEGNWKKRKRPFKRTNEIEKIFEVFGKKRKDH